MYLAGLSPVNLNRVSSDVSLAERQVAQLRYIHGTDEIPKARSACIGVMTMLRSKAAFALLNNLILSKMLTFAPGKLLASYYTSFIHCCTLQLPASAQLLSTPSWEPMRHSAGSHNHQEEAHRRSITKALRAHEKTLPSYSRHIPRRGRAQEGRGPLQRHARHRARHPGPRRTRAFSVHGL